MNTDEQRAFVSMLTASAELFDKTLSAGVIDLYWRCLRDYDLKAVARAMERSINGGAKFMPRPGELVELMQGSAVDKSMLAWSQVLSTVRRHGSGPSVVFDDPTTMRVIEDMGGWCVICQTSEDETPFKAREFEQRYRGYRTRGEIDKFPNVLHGRFDAYNMPKGLPTDPPVLIGDRDKAMEVLSHASGVEGPIKALLNGIVNRD